MPKIEKYDDDEEDGTVRLELREDPVGVKLVAVDKYGILIPGGEILFIAEDGKLHRNTSIGISIPLATDEKGRIVIGKDDEGYALSKNIFEE